MEGRGVEGIADRAFGKLHQPDKGGDADDFKVTNEAYETFEGEEKSANYNAKKAAQGSNSSMS